MLTRIDLDTFKCFNRLKLPLSSLTLLSGSNASGKSSVLQSLALLNQTMREHEWSSRLMLNGGVIRLGTAADIIDKVYGRRSVGIGISNDKNSCKWRFSGERAEMSMTVDSVEVDGVTQGAATNLRYLLPGAIPVGAQEIAKCLRTLVYITAERVGPREVYPVEDRQEALVVGSAGEHAVSVLHWGRDEEVLAGLAIPDVSPTRLKQVEARMRQFVPGFALILQSVAQANAVTLGLRSSEDTDFHRPAHTGFGLTQILPIVVAALSARANELLLIENPEVHLHPSGQALMGQFLCEVAREGVQVVVESHSDHVLNGIRRAVKAKTIAADDVAVHFFTPRLPGTAQVVSPKIDRDGRLDTWPVGFFDQVDKDLSHLAGWDG